MARQTTESYIPNRIVLKRDRLDKIFTLEKGVGKIEAGQVLAMKTESGKLVKYNPTGTDGSENPFTTYTGGSDGTETADSTDKDIQISCFSPGTDLDQDRIIGLDIKNDFKGLYKLYLAGIYLQEVRD